MNIKFQVKKSLIASPSNSRIPDTLPFTYYSTKQSLVKNSSEYFRRDSYAKDTNEIGKLGHVPSSVRISTNKLNDTRTIRFSATV